MKYKIMTLNKEDKEDILIDDLPETEVSSIKEKLAWLKMSMLSKDFYVMLRDNVGDLLDYIPNLDIRNKYTFDDLNRYLYNVLGSFYAFIEYYEHNFKTMFAPIKSKYFDTYFEYRMMYALRLYTTHHGPAITSYRISYNAEGEAIVEIIVKPKELLENSSRFNRIIKHELQQMVEDEKLIEVCDVVIKFKEMIEKFHKELLKALEKDVRIVIKDFDKYLVYENGNAIDSYIIDENNEIIEDITNSLKIFVKKMCNPY